MNNGYRPRKATLMTDTAKPADRILAHRIVRATGVDTDKLNESARASLGLLQQRQRDDAEDKTVPLPDARATWMFHSGKQLHRFFGGFCVACQHWKPGANDTGACATIAAALAVKSPVSTTATFGCHLWGELPTGDAAEITARTEIAMTLGLLQQFPDDVAPLPDVIEADGTTTT